MRMSRLSGAAAFPIVAAFASFAYPNGAQAYDIDCKLILCMAGGFPATCGDAYDHMIDRLRDGKSPVGTCTMSDGSSYSNYTLDYSFANQRTSDAWICPEGKYKHFSVGYDGSDREQVKVFCYDERRQLGYGFGREKTHYYTGVTTPEYKNFRVQITVEPGTSAEYTNGIQRYRTSRGHGYGFGTRVSFQP